MQVLGGDGLEFGVDGAEVGVEALVFQFWVIEEIALPNEVFEGGEGGEPEIVEQGDFFGAVSDERIGSFYAFLQHGVDFCVQVFQGVLLVNLFKFSLKPVVAEVDEGI